MNSTVAASAYACMCVCVCACVCQNQHRRNGAAPASFSREHGSIVPWARINICQSSRVRTGERDAPRIRSAEEGSFGKSSKKLQDHAFGRGACLFGRKAATGGETWKEFSVKGVVPSHCLLCMDLCRHGSMLVVGVVYFKVAPPANFVSPDEEKRARRSGGRRRDSPSEFVRPTNRKLSVGFVQAFVPGRGLDARDATHGNREYNCAHTVASVTYVANGICTNSTWKLHMLRHVFSYSIHLRVTTMFV